MEDHPPLQTPKLIFHLLPFLNPFRWVSIHVRRQPSFAKASFKCTFSTELLHCGITKQPTYSPTQYQLPQTQSLPLVATMSTPNPEDLEPEQTEGFKVGEKKTIDEYQKLGTSSTTNPFHTETHLLTDMNFQMVEPSRRMAIRRPLPPHRPKASLRHNPSVHRRLRGVAHGHAAGEEGQYDQRHHQQRQDVY